MPKRGRKRKKSRTHVVENENNAASALATAEESKVPKTLVIRRGRCEAEVGELVRNLRLMMMPYTALHFQDDAATHHQATLTSYVKHLALPMGITHMLVFTQSTTSKKSISNTTTSTDHNNNNINNNHIPHPTTSHLNLRLVKTPQGPTLWFRVHQFSLNRHVQAIQKRPYQLSAELNQHPPIVVTNNFGSSSSSSSSGGGPDSAASSSSSSNTPPHIKLMRITFQNMFPAINVATVSLSSCRRVVLFHLVEEEEEDDNNDDHDQTNDNNNNNNNNTPRRKRQVVQVRHYAIKTSTPKAIQNRRVQRLLHPTKSFPNLHHVQDIADYIAGQSHRGGGSTGSIASDSEVSDDEDQVEVVLPTDRQSPPMPAAVARKKSKKASDASTTTTASSSSSTQHSLSSRSAVLKLVELGPRLSLELIKVEKGLESQGSVVLYHAHIQKRPEEVQALQKRHEQQALLKRQRQAVQQANVERKQQQQQQKLKQKEAKKTNKKQLLPEQQQQQQKDDDDDNKDDDNDDDADDEEQGIVEEEDDDGNDDEDDAEDD